MLYFSVSLSLEAIAGDLFKKITRIADLKETPEFEIQEAAVPLV